MKLLKIAEFFLDILVQQPIESWASSKALNLDALQRTYCIFKSHKHYLYF